ncbi:LuxR C-terminal-related transcriptional regulator [Nocardia sp. CA-107356]|uniref:LuxR C-terminal-related transcriptional regulator n=1 Tax=Nocardia sp. CA-107356 TaxID=3239972 RepID=UPI003D93452C
MSATRRRHAGDLMAATGDFVGRGPQLDKISTLLLGSARLVTLIGSGGIGKTRLATEVLRRFGKAGPTPVYWVRLARLANGSDASAVMDEAAQSVVGADFSGRSGWDALVDALTRTDAVGRNLQTVLVMDNCEHVLAGAGQLIAELLEAVPGLTILATSCEAIGWVDEHVVVVPPLTQQQALTLFRQRAVLTDHPIIDTDTHADQTAMAGLICRHVHNHPLYIRLAAARLSRQPLAMVLSELSGEATDKRMRWSHGPRVGAEPRHQGVRDVIAWSYDLCRDEKQLLLNRMSVFAAGYDTNPEDDITSARNVGADLEAIEVVCADDPAPGRDRVDGETVVSVATEDVEGLLESLADKSLVTRHITPTAVRYSLLESIRVFAQQRLEERSTDEVDEPARLAQRHLRYYRDKVVAAQLNWFSFAEPDLLDWARAAWDNIVTAIETSLTSGMPALGLEISTGLIALPIYKGSPREIRRWTERTLQATRTLTPEPDELQIAAMALIGWLALLQGRNDDAERMLEECVAACIDDPKIRQNWRQAPEADIGLPAPVEVLWGVELMAAHRDPSAITVLARAREKFHALGDHGGESRSEWHEALAASFLGSAQQALEINRRDLDHATASGDRWAISWAEMAWAIALTKHGDPIEALALGRATMARQEAAGDHWGAALAVFIRIWSLAQAITNSIAAGSTDQAELEALATETTQLAGGAKALRAGPGVYFGDLGVYADETKKAIDVARRVLGPEAFAAAYRQGSLLRPDLREVQRLALGTLSMDRLAMDHPARKHTPSRWGELSAAEQQVATLAAAGWTNSAIAARRGNSGRTVDAQMAAIFQKLTISSREDIIELVPRDQIDEVRKEAARRPRRTAQRSRTPRPR